MTTMMVESSSALDAHYPQSMLMRTQTAGSFIEHHGWQVGSRRVMDYPFDEHPHGGATAHHVTNLLTDARTRSALIESCAVFAPDGRAPSPARAYWRRIDVLRGYAADDGYSLNSHSEFDFWRFIRSLPRLRKASLVLMDNGNLRAMWKDNEGTRVGLQFLGDEILQYVIFRRRPASRLISRASGRDIFKGWKRQIDAFDLGSLLYE